jgi:putative acetyltransferase
VPILGNDAPARVEIREETRADLPGIRQVNARAFGRSHEARIVDELRSNGAALLSLVAVRDGHVVGHILYSPASIADVVGAALGPMAVLPEYQRQGIGSRLVATGNRILAGAGCPFIIVLGHAEFYPRFGFQPAKSLGITCEWDVPDDAFMVAVLNEQRMTAVSGRAVYRHEFTTVAPD